MNLLVFTSTYPYDGGAEQTFLEEEIAHLKGAFDHVTFVPENRMGTLLPLPGGFEVDESFASLLASNRVNGLLQTVFVPALYSDILNRPSILIHPAMLMRLVNFVRKAILTRVWIDDWLTAHDSNGDQFVFYTYWFDYAAMGIGLAKRKYSNIRLISRAHGYDLYEERHAYNYWPCRRTAISMLDRLCLDSKAGLDYITDRYPEFRSKYETAFLGVKRAGFVASQSMDHTFRIVSCSRLVPVKRVDLILDGIARLAQLLPNVDLEWHHFGNGDTRSDLQDRANSVLPPSARAFFPGYSDQSELFRFYEENPVDVFINASQSEGTPVAIMEAISCGIPVIATSVGGNVEIVNSRNGLLLSPNPSPDEIAMAFLEIQSQPGLAREKRVESVRMWNEKYNAEKNFGEFAHLLRNLHSS